MVKILKPCSRTSSWLCFIGATYSQTGQWVENCRRHFISTERDFTVTDKLAIKRLNLSIQFCSMKNLTINLFMFLSMAFGTVIAPTLLWAKELSQTPLGVVELFTSQGCSSCPPADRTLSKLIEEGQILALSYHVDYWNYLGWEDTLSLKSATDRQYAYAKSFHRRGVYTPQAVLNGRDHVVGGEYDTIKTRLSYFSQVQKGLHIPISLSKLDGEMTISVGQDPNRPDPNRPNPNGPDPQKQAQSDQGPLKADVVIVYFDAENIVDVTRGENRGKTMTYHHSVRDIQTIGMWDGTAKDFVLPASMINKINAGGCAILLQSTTKDGSPSAIIGATAYKM